MVGTDDVSFVVGRLIGDDKFDLVAAGYRDPRAHLFRDRAAEISRSLHVVEAAVVGRKSVQHFPQIDLSHSDEELLAAVVLDSTERFCHAVEAQGAWKCLYDGDKAAHESRHQALFRLFTTMSFNSLSVHVHPGADHGSGATDITLTRGKATHVVEFKKDSDRTKTLHGLTVQLPKYMESSRANRELTW